MQANLYSSGLVAVGRYRDWHVDIHEISSNATTNFQVVLEHSVTTIQFGVRDSSNINQIIAFLRELQPTSHEIELVKYQIGSLYFLFDEEQLYFVSRLRNEWGELDMLRLGLSDDDRKSLILALEDAVEDLTT